MNKVKIADLKNNLSRYLAYVREGGELLVLDRDTPVARVVPFVARDAEPTRVKGARKAWTEERLAEMERMGLIKRGDVKDVHEWLTANKPVRLPRGTGSVVDTLLQMRDEDAR